MAISDATATREIVVTDIIYPADEAQVAGILYRPAKVEGKVRGISIMHGGPTSRAMLLSEDYLCRALTRRGWVVLAGHYRQETGFSGTDNADAIGTLDYLEKLPYVDPARLGMGGHSRGGFATQRIAGGEPRIKSIVSLGSGTDMADVDERMKPYSFTRYVSLFSMGGGTPEGNARRRKTKGPSAADLAAIKVPALWVHGSRDLNAPPESAIQAYESVKNNGNPRARLEMIDGMDHFWGHPSGPLHQRVADIVADWFESTL